MKSIRRLVDKEGSKLAFAKKYDVHLWQVTRWYEKNAQVDKYGVIWVPSTSSIRLALTQKGDNHE